MGETNAAADKKAKETGTVIPINPEGLERYEHPEEEDLAASYHKTVRAMFLVFLAMAVVTVAVNVNKYPEMEKPSVSAIGETAETISAIGQASEPAHPAAEPAMTVEPVSAATKAETAAGASVFPLGINTATGEELQLIPGIGPVTAEKIVRYREQIGTITEFDDLLPIDGIGQKTVAKLAEYCYID
ncbi:MAG TPA: helix-hairpin-helix domain-containing protein [Oscillospiraceae bacterium]|nr:helix-hairpin-helix domain-containing protein [Oscillospiraceae bacterium]HNW05190.1 helix-hairpin-helix domain-containing protein [Oscillospiraceae bacterium]HPV99847.1 helix-hairpin-helix domain-containing protein [Oscillospiraceae bacterium]